MVSQGRRAANVGPVHGVCMYPIAPVASNWSRCLFRTGCQFVMSVVQFFTKIGPVSTKLHLQQQH